MKKAAFAHLVPHRCLCNLVDAAHVREYDEGDVIAHENCDEGDLLFYMLMQGTATHPYMSCTCHILCYHR
jgi:hypothetical protein